jgi:hypothetical protein
VNWSVQAGEPVAETEPAVGIDNPECSWPASDDLLPDQNDVWTIQSKSGTDCLSEIYHQKWDIPKFMAGLRSFLSNLMEQDDDWDGR